MGLFNKNGGMLNVIRCDEPSYLIWKWHPDDSQPVKNKRENSIRWGSSLRVKEGSVAVFTYNYGEGTQQDFLEGPCDIFLQSANLPVLSGLLGIAYGGDTPFQSEIYFINLAKIVQIPFAVPFFDVFDPRYMDFGVPVAVRGTITFNITDYRKFIKLHRLENFDLETFQKQIKDAVVRYVKGVVANIPYEKKIPVVQIEREIAKINEIIEERIQERFQEDFGVNVSAVDINAIEIDKSSSGYVQLKRVTQDITSATVIAQSETDIQNMRDMQRINAENTEETMRIQREEAQYAQHKQTQTANFAAYQTEVQGEVGTAGANALGQIDAGGANISGNGFNPATMIAGMTIGSAVGRNIANTMNNIMSGDEQVNPATPPPISTNCYHVAVNGQSTGPFDISVLTQMASTGTLTRESLVWKQGMANWVRADSMQELQSVFDGIVPPVPC